MRVGAKLPNSGALPLAAPVVDLAGRAGETSPPPLLAERRGVDWDGDVAAQAACSSPLLVSDRRRGHEMVARR